MSLSAFEEIVLDPHASESQKAAAQKMIEVAKAKGKPEAEPTGNVVLPDGPIHTRQDKTTYRSHSLVISRDYAADLQRKYGTLHSGQATEEAAGQRLQSAVDPMTDRDDFLKQFPESEAFWDDAKDRLKTFYSEIDAQSKMLKAKQEEKATPVVEYDTSDTFVKALESKPETPEEWMARRAREQAREQHRWNVQMGVGSFCGERH